METTPVETVDDADSLAESPKGISQTDVKEQTAVDSDDDYVNEFLELNFDSPEPTTGSSDQGELIADDLSTSELRSSDDDQSPRIVDQNEDITDSEEVALNWLQGDQFSETVLEQSADGLLPFEGQRHDSIAVAVEAAETELVESQPEVIAAETVLIEPAVPVSEPALVADSNQCSHHASAARPVSVCVVSANTSERSAIRNYLRTHQLTCTALPDFDSALTSISRNRFDVVLIHGNGLATKEIISFCEDVADLVGIPSVVLLRASQIHAIDVLSGIPRASWSVLPASLKEIRLKLTAELMLIEASESRTVCSLCRLTSDHCEWKRKRSLSQIRFLSSALLGSAILLNAGCGGSEESPAVLLEKARIQMQRDEVAQAIPILDQVVTIAPDSAEARYQRGVAMETVGALEKALLDYNECLKISSDRKDALNNKAVVLAKLDRFDEAEAVFTKLVDLNPEESLGYRNRALCNVDREKYDEALADYAKALELDPKEPANWYQRGALYQIQQRWKDAESDFTKALELNPELPFAYMNRGVVRYRQGNRSGAAEDLAKAQELDSTIVVPDVGFFAESSSPMGSVTESLDASGASLWIAVRKLAEQDLATRGATDITIAQEFPDRHCAEFKATMNGQSQSIVVALTQDGKFEVPAALLSNGSAEASTPERGLLLINPGKTSSDAPGVTLFQPNWPGSTGSAKPSMFEFAVPAASAP